MQQVNVVAAQQYFFIVANKQRPYSNNFTVNSAEVKQYNNKDEVHCVVTCTQDSIEAGRVYYCIFTTKGKLVACNTLN